MPKTFAVDAVVEISFIIFISALLSLKPTFDERNDDALSIFSMNFLFLIDGNRDI